MSVIEDDLAYCPNTLNPSYPSPPKQPLVFDSTVCPMKILQHIGPLGFADANELQIHRVVNRLSGISLHSFGHWHWSNKASSCDNGDSEEADRWK